ncbi:protein BCCIP homolog isoform X3 [Dendrobium catenatum]|uniref:protein BCCIP homolog isoform X3 n=1 Tax=Dendrobium catenatum TaxID=906689 RepID=UPI00109FD166|nr:protein BCCIP homolog isoform X3 [Dendrobium catenatum]
MGRSAKRRRLPNLPLFSSFSRALHLTRLTSAARARVSENSLASKAAAQSDDAGLKHPTKIKRVDSSFSSDNNDEEEHLLEKGAIVQADFGFFDPKPGDFHGVKLLLQNYLDEKPWDLSGFVDLILGQTTVGTVVKLDGNDEVEEDGDEEDLYAVISALNFGRYGGHQCIGELKEFLVGVCGDESVKTKLKVLLEQQASDVGLLVSQRFVNCPHQLVPPLYDALFDEVSWAIEDENKHANQYNAKAGNDSDEPIIYLKAEDELFHEMSSFSYTFHLHSSPFVPHELKNYRAMGLVMVINASVIPKFRQNLKTLLAES